MCQFTCSSLCTRLSPKGGDRAATGTESACSWCVRSVLRHDALPLSRTPAASARTHTHAHKHRMALLPTTSATVAADLDEEINTPLFARKKKKEKKKIALVFLSMCHPSVVHEVTAWHVILSDQIAAKENPPSIWLVCTICNLPLFRAAGTPPCSNPTPVPGESE